MSTDLHLADQGRRPAFRFLLGVQALAAGVFGLLPLLIPRQFADVTGYSGDDILVYQLAGAATTGYLVAAAAALIARTSWVNLRIPLIATLTFTAAAALASLFSLVTGDSHQVVIVVLVAAAVFALIAVYWLRRNEGPAGDPGPAIAMPFRIVIVLATISAAVFGIVPLVLPGFFAPLVGLEGTDEWIFRMAGAACLGYATAGVLTLQARGYHRFAIQNLAAITFNALAAVCAIKAVLVNAGGVLAPVVAVAAGFFAVALTALSLRYRREGMG
jgi:hypothetical protein